MGKKPSIVEINGNKYDAKNGRLINHPLGPVIDGLMRKPQPGRIINKITDNINYDAPTFTSAKERLRKPAQTVHKRAQQSKTLMRGVVSKPKNAPGKNANQQSSKLQLGSVKPSRLSRAINMTKSSKVQRFGQPMGKAKSALSSAAAHSKNSLAASSSQAQAAPSSAALAATATPSVLKSVSHQRLERMLDEALLRADAHKQALKNHARGKRRFSKRPAWVPRWVAAVVITLVVAGLGAYFAWQKVPYASTKLASLRAEIKGSVPAYVPSGFKFAGPTQYESGAISMTYMAEEESRYFTLIQKASNWDSSSLEANTMTDDAQVQTSQVKGTTVYYSGDQATWVSNGKRYIINDHAQLNPGELFKIAESIL